MRQASAVVACSNILGETPVWSARENALYWVDIRAPALHRFKPEGDTHESWAMPELCGGVVLATTGVIVILRRTVSHFDPDRNVLTPLLELEPADMDNRLNEAKCDRTGRLWVGSMRDYGAAVSGSLYAIDGDLRARRVFKDIRIPNSLAWSPEGDVMYFADTGERIMRRYRFDQKVGTPTDRSTLLDADGAPGRPDGSTVDAEGYIWNARYAGSCVVRIAPDGKIDSTIGLPVSQITSCAFGGPEMRTLFITTASQKLSPDERAAEPQAGHLFAVDTDVPGLAEAEFPLHPENGKRPGSAGSS